MASITVNTNGQTLTVNASISHWTSAALAVVASGDDDIPSTTTTTITSAYTMHFANTATVVTVTVKQPDGSTLLAQTFEVNPGVGPRTLNPVPSPDQVAADLSLQSPTWALAVGNATMSRFDTGSAVSTATGTMRLTGFRAERSELATKVRFITGSTAAAATPTLARVGLFTVDPTTGNGTLVAATASDTALASAANTAYEKALADSYQVVRGQQYALGILFVSAGQCPTLVGKNDVNGGTEVTEIARLPRPCGSVTSLADLPASYVNASLTASASIWYGVVSA